MDSGNPCSNVTLLREEIFYSAISTIICSGAIGHHEMYSLIGNEGIDFLQQIYVTTLEMSVGS